MLAKPGLRFEHARVLGPDNRPAAYIVTRVAQGVVWYRQADERKAKEYCPVDEFPRIVGKTL